ncbi:unnamed protein product [Arctogadus glacialis]
MTANDSPGSAMHITKRKSINSAFILKLCRSLTKAFLQGTTDDEDIVPQLRKSRSKVRGCRRYQPHSPGSSPREEECVTEIVRSRSEQR